VDKAASFRLLWSSKHARPDDVLDVNRIRIWSHDRRLFDAEFLDDEFGSNRYQSVHLSAELGLTWSHPR